MTRKDALGKGKKFIREHNQAGWTPERFRMKDLIVLPCTKFVEERVHWQGGDCKFRIVNGVIR